MARNKQNDKAKKDGNRRKETKEEKKHRLKNAQGAREVSYSLHHFWGVVNDPNIRVDSLVTL